MDTGVRALGRFAWWGLTHGPVWAVGALLLARLLPESAGATGHGLAWDLATGAAAGILLGPVVGLLVGGTCLLADRLPRWLLDAPDYVAVGAVLLVAAGVQRELPGAGDPVLTFLVVGALALPAALDAALLAPALLHPDSADAREGAVPARVVPARWLRPLASRVPH